MITYNDVMLARMVFEKFWEQELPFKLAEKIESFLIDTNNIKEKVESKRVALLEKYSKKDDNGDIIYNTNGELPSIELDDPDSFFKEFNCFLDTDINYNFDEDLFFNDDDLLLLKCTPEEVKNVKWFTSLRI